MKKGNREIDQNKEGKKFSPSVLSVFSVPFIPSFLSRQ